MSVQIYDLFRDETRDVIQEEFDQVELIAEIFMSLANMVRGSGGIMRSNDDLRKIARGLREIRKHLKGASRD